MDLELDDDQSAWRDELRRMLAARCDHDVLRAAVELPGAVDRELWQRVAATGFFALRQAGSGAGLAEVVIGQEEVGRAAVPGPVSTTAALARYLPGAADGSVVATPLFLSQPWVIEHLAGADTVAVLAPDGVRLLEPSAITGIDALTPLDPLTPVHRGHDPVPVGSPLLGPEDAAEVWRTGTLLTAAAQVGLAGAAVDMGVEYAKQRTQFGRPIGSFQAVKHLLADALAGVEIARAMVHTAAVLADEDFSLEEYERAVGSARVLASRAARGATRACIQVHGGMGFTWEVAATST